MFVSDATVEKIDAETPTLAGTAASIGLLLRQAAQEMSAFATIFDAQDSFAYSPSTSSGLVFGFKGGRVHYGDGGAPTEVAAGTVTLSNATTNYVEYQPSTGTVVKNTSGFTTGNIPLYTVVTSGGAFTDGDVADKRTSYAVIYGKVIGADNLADAVGTRINQAVITIGAEVSNVRAITINIKTLESTPAAITERRQIECWLADAVNGWETATSPSGGVAIGTGTAMDVPTVARRLRMMTNASGVAVLNITEVGTHSWYLAVRIGSKVDYSAIISFT